MPAAYPGISGVFGRPVAVSVFIGKNSPNFLLTSFFLAERRGLGWDRKSIYLQSRTFWIHMKLGSFFRVLRSSKYELILFVECGFFISESLQLFAKTNIQIPGVVYLEVYPPFINIICSPSSKFSAFVCISPHESVIEDLWKFWTLSCGASGVAPRLRWHGSVIGRGHKWTW